MWLDKRLELLDDALSVWRPIYTQFICLKANLPKAWFPYGRNGRKDWVTIFLNSWNATDTFAEW
jgi:hypothetical protein